jgi:hypothetical protein
MNHTFKVWHICQEEYIRRDAACCVSTKQQKFKLSRQGLNYFRNVFRSLNYPARDLILQTQNNTIPGGIEEEFLIPS